MPFSISRRLLRTAGFSLLALAGLTCRDRSLTGPGLTAPGKLRIAPSISSTAAPFGPAFTLGGVRVTLTPYPGTGEPVLERVASFTSGSDQLSLDLTVQLLQSTQRFVLRIAAVDAQAPHDTIFRSVDTVTVTAGTDSPTPQAITLVYDGHDKDIASITVEPVDTTFRTTDNVQMRAVARRTDGTAVTDARLGYSVGDATNAQVSATGLLGARVPSAGFANMVVTVGSANGVTGTTRITGRVPVVAVEVTSAGGVTQPITGTTLQLTGTVRGPNAVALTDRVVTWGTTNAQRATVSATGLVTAGPDTGDVAITFASEGVSTQLALRVRLVPIAAVRIALPSPLPSFETGDTITLRATAEAANGQPLAGRQVTWATTTPALVRVLDDGRVIALAPGAAQVTATAEGVTGTAALTVVRPAVASLVLGPDPLSVVRGGTAPTTITLADKRGSSLTGRTVAYASTRPAAATVDGAGVVTGLVAGDTTSIIASSEGKADTIHVTVTPRPVASIALAPDSSDVIVGQTVAVAAVARDAQGNANTDFPVVWQSLTPQLASVSAQGVVTALAPGRAVVRATAGGTSADAVVRVRPVPVARVVISPRLELSMRSHDTLGLSAVAQDAQGNALAGRAVTWAVVDGPVTVLQDGRVIAGVVTAQTRAHVSATVEGMTDVVEIDVLPQPVARLILSPKPLNLVRGETAQLAVALRDRRDNPLSGSVSFVSTRPTVASVDAGGHVTGLVARDTASVIASSDGRADTVHVTVAPRPVQSVESTPESLELIVGRTVQLTATAFDDQHQPNPDFPITWVSLNPELATVNAATGVVTGVQLGRAVIRATAGDATSGLAYANVVVQVIGGPVARVVVTPEAPSMFSQDTIALAAAALGENGETLQGRAITWTVADGPVTVLQDGRVIAGVVLQPSIAHVVASSEGQSATAVIMVSPQPVASLVLTPDQFALDRGATRQLTVVLRDRRGNALAGRLVFFASSRQNVASVDPNGVVTGLAAGDTASIIATSEGRADTSHVVVGARPVKLVTVTPDSVDVVVGATVQLSAVPRDVNDQPTFDYPTVFDSPNPEVASVTAGGLVRGVAVGKIRVRATSGEGQGFAVVNVIPVPVGGVAITPNPAAMFSQDTVQLSATVSGANGQPLPGRVIVWAVVDGPVTVLPDGRVIAGTVTARALAHVTATSEGTQATATITIDPQPVASVILSPEPLDVVRGNTAQLLVSLRDRRNNPLARAVSFVSTRPAAEVSASGVVTGLIANDTASIIATSEGVTGTAHVRVLPRPAASLTAVPDSQDVIAGRTAPITASVLDDRGQPNPDFPPAFQSLSPNVATVHPTTGIITAVSVGRAVIRVTAGAQTVDVVVRVVPVPTVQVSVDRNFFTMYSRDTVRLNATILVGGQPQPDRAVIWQYQTGPATLEPIRNTNSVLVLASVVDRDFVVRLNAVDATDGRIFTTVVITVSPQPVASVALTPDPLSVVRGSTAQLGLVLRDFRGDLIQGRDGEVSYTSTRPNVASVNRFGIVEGFVARDTASIIASVNGHGAITHVIVQPRPVASITVVPDSSDLVRGRTVQLTATARDDVGAANGDFPVAFQSLTPNLATVSATGLVTATAEGRAVIRATAGGVFADAVVQVRQTPVARVIVSPDAATIFSNDTLPMSAAAFAADGEPLPGRAVVWAVQDAPATVLRVLQDGRAIAGTVTARTVVHLTATVEGIPATATITVDPQPVASVSLTPEPLDVVRGSTAQLTVTLRDRRNNPLARAVTFTSTRPAAGVSQTGLVTGLIARDTASIIATSEGVSGTAHVSVLPRPVASVTIAPDSSDVVRGGTVQLTATVRDELLALNGDFPVAFQSLTPNLATVSATGLVTTTAEGRAVIRATAGGVSADAVVQVRQTPVARVIVSPDAVTIFSNDTLALSSAAFAADGTPLPGRAVVWAVVDGPVTVLPDGRVIAGTVTARALAHVTGTTEGRSATATITVDPQPVAVLVLTPDPLDVIRGGTGQLNVALRDRRNNPLARAVSFVSTRPSTAGVSATGLVTGLIANDTASVIATSEGRADTVRVRVQPRPLASLTVAPTSANLFVGETITIVPTRLDAQGQPNADFPVAFQSLSPSVASVDQVTGVVTALTAGQATIRASSSTFTADAAVTVAQRTDRVAVTPRPVPTLDAIGAQQTLSAAAFAGQGPVTGAAFTWVSRTPAVATVTGAPGAALTAQVTAAGNGTAWIVATLVGSNPIIADSVQVTVAQSIASLTLAPDTATRYLGTLLQYSASARDPRQNPVPAAFAASRIGWSTRSGGQVASVDANGLATMRAIGTDSVIVAAVTGPARAASFVTVRSPITRIFMPADQHVATALGEVLTFSAFALDTAGTPMPGVPLAWASSNPAVLRYDSVGVASGLAYFTALNNGQVDVTATAQGVQGLTNAIVNQRLAQIRLEPAAGATLTVGGALAIQGTYFDRNGFPMQAQQQPIWGVRNEVGDPPGTSVAAVNQSGVVTALGKGTIDIVATLSNVTSNAVRVEVQGLAIVFAQNVIQVGTRTSTSVQVQLNGAANGPVTVYVYPANPALVQLAGNGGFGDNNGAGLLFPRGTTSATLTINGTQAGTTKLYAVEGVCNDGCRAEPKPTLIPDTADVTVASAIAIASPVHVARGDSVLTRLVLQDPAPAGGLTVDFRFSQTGVVDVMGARVPGAPLGTVNTVTVPAGLLAADIYVRGLAQGGTDITPVPRNSAVPGFRQTAVVTQGQLFLMSYLDFYAGDTVFVIGEGQTGSFYAESNVAASSAPGDSLRVGLTVADGRIAGTDIASAVIPTGETFAPFRLTGIARGRTTITAAAANAGSGVWQPATRAVRVTTPRLVMTSAATGTPGQPPATPNSTPSSLSIVATDSLGFQHPRATALAITLRSDNVAAAVVDSARVTLEPGDFASAFSRIRFVGPGTARIIAEAPGHIPDTVTVTVVAGKLQFASFSGQRGTLDPIQSATLAVGQTDYSVYVSVPGAAPARTTLTVRRLPVSGGPFSTSPATLTLPQGFDNVELGALTGLAVGTERVEVSAPGYEPDTLVVNVLRGTISASSLPDTVQAGQTGSFTLQLQNAPAGTITVTPSPANGASRLLNINGGPAVFTPGSTGSSTLTYAATGAGTVQLSFTPDNPNYDVLTRPIVIIPRKLVAFVRTADGQDGGADTIGIGQRTSQNGAIMTGVRTNVDDGATTTIRVRSLDPQVALVGPGTTNDTTVFLCQDCNETEESFHVRGVARGTARIEVSAAQDGYTPDTLIVRVGAGRLLTLAYGTDPAAGIPESMVAGSSYGLEVSLTDSISYANQGYAVHLRDADGSVTLRLSSSNANVVRVVGQFVRIPVGTPALFIDNVLTATGPGVATVTFEDSTTWANRGNPTFAPRYAAVSRAVTVAGRALQISNGDDSRTLGMRQRFGFTNGQQQLTGGLQVCLDGVAAGVTTSVRVTSSQPRIAQIPTQYSTITLAAPGSFSSLSCGSFDVIAQDSIGVVAIAVQALDPNGLPAAGIAVDSLRLDVGRPRLYAVPASSFTPIVIGQPTAASLRIYAADQTGQIRYPAENVPLALTNENPGVATVAATGTMLAGSFFLDVPITPVAPGQARFTVADGRTTPVGAVDVRYGRSTSDPAVTVRRPVLEFVSGPGSDGIRMLNGGYSVRRPFGKATPDTVTITISDPARGTVSPATMIIPAGSTSRTPLSTYTVSSIADGPATVTLTATATGYDPSTSVVQFAPGVFTHFSVSSGNQFAIALGDSVAMSWAAYEPTGDFGATLTAAQSFVLNLPSQLELWTGGANSARVANNTVTIAAAGTGRSPTYYLKGVAPGTGTITSSSNANFQPYTSPSFTVTVRWAAIGLGSGPSAAPVAGVPGGTLACGVASNGRGYCWGDNSQGAFGNGSTTAAPVLTPVGPSGIVAALDPNLNGEVGSYHACTVRGDSLAFCAGRNASGQLGDGTTNGSATPVTLAPSPTSGNMKFTVVSPGDNFTCGIGWPAGASYATARERGAYCWGTGGGAIGTGVSATTLVPRPTFVGMTAGAGLTTISSGTNSACGSSGSTVLMCWGVGTFGQIGNGGTPDEQREPGIVSAPLAPTGASRVWRSVKVGNQFACGVVTLPGGLSGYDVYCWGRNDFGQLAATTQSCGADKVTLCSAAPVRVAALSGRVIISLAVGATHVCALDNTDILWCWGRNNAGQLGSASAGGPTPIQATRPAGMTGFRTRVDAGVESTCATTSTGEGYCWGANIRGQLGTGAAEGTVSATPQKVADPGAGSLGGASAPGGRVIAGRME